MSLSISSSIAPSKGITLSFDRPSVLKAMVMTEVLGNTASYVAISRPVAVMVHTMLAASQFFTGTSLGIYLSMKSFAASVISMPTTEENWNKEDVYTMFEQGSRNLIRAAVEILPIPGMLFAVYDSLATYKIDTTGVAHRYFPSVELY